MAHLIIGHQETLAMFDRLMRGEGIAHAYLLVGPPRVGKTTVAGWVAARALCERGGVGAASAMPCGTCVRCVQAMRGAHPDVLRVTEPSSSIGIEAVRDWVTALSRSSLLNGWMIGIVEGVERLTEEAANACLKAIEEPAPRRIILLTATQRAQVLPTIRSRCCLVRLHRVPTVDMVAGLQDRGVAAADAEAIAASADGCPGTAIAWAEDPDARAAAVAREEFASGVLHGPYAERLRQIDALVRKFPEDRGLARQETREIIRAFRRISTTLITRLSGIAESVNREVDHIPPPPNRGGARGGPVQRDIQIAPRELLRWMESLTRASAYVSANVAPRLILETIVLSFP